MGAVNFSIDRRLVQLLTDALGFRVFVETGTFEGDTIEAVQGLFDQILSVEMSEDYYRKAQNRFRRQPHITLSHDESPSFLQSRADELSTQPVLFWLDAHWCHAENTVGPPSQCPLLEELAAIQTLHANSLVMIDDARLFLCKPCAPHNIGQWPAFQEVADLLQSLSPDHRLMVLNDVILFHPPAVSGLLEQYAHTHGIDWLRQLNLARQVEELQLDARKQAEMEAYLAEQGLDMSNAPQTLWEQLLEKEKIIQDMTEQQLEPGARKRAEIGAYLAEQGLDVSKAPEALWEQLVEKEKIIQDLAEQLKEAQLHIAQLKSS